MRGKLWFIGGLATGFVLGARAGREKYEELVLKGRKVLDHPTVQEAAGVAQAQATRLYSEGKDKLSQSKLGEKLSTGADGRKPELGSTTSSTDTTLATSTAGSGKSTTSTTPTPGPSARPKPSSGTGTNGSSV